MAELGIALPSGYCPCVSGLRTHKGRVLLHDGCTVVVGLKTTPQPDEVSHTSCSMFRALGPVSLAHSASPTCGNAVPWHRGLEQV